MAYPDKANFLKDGIEPHQQSAPLKCAICLQETQHALTSPKPNYIPTHAHIQASLENSIQIKACGHAFGKTCLSIWCDTSNTCPMCRRELFDKPPIEIVVGDPTREHRLEFADLVERTFRDPEVAERIRQNPMAPPVRDLMLDVIAEILQQEEPGVRVTLRYYGDDGGDNEGGDDMDDEDVPESEEVGGFVHEEGDDEEAGANQQNADTDVD